MAKLGLNHPIWIYVIAACLVYPLIYDGRQMYHEGLNYLNDKWNFVDMIHILFGYINLVMQYFF